MKCNRSGQAALISPDDWIKMKRQLKNGWFKTFLYIGYLTGERWGAIRQLKASDVYHDDGSLKDWITFRRSTRKGKDETRQVPIHPELRPVLEGRKPDGAWMFPAPRCNDSPIILRSCDAALRRLLSRCGLDGKGISCHSTRATFITNMHRLGADVVLIQECTGHKDLKSLSRYIRRDPDRVVAAVNKLIA